MATDGTVVAVSRQSMRILASTLCLVLALTCAVRLLFSEIVSEAVAARSIDDTRAGVKTHWDVQRSTQFTLPTPSETDLIATNTDVGAVERYNDTRADVLTYWDSPRSTQPPARTPRGSGPVGADLDVVALLTVPRLGDDVFELPVRIGVGSDALDNGVGVFPGASPPGTGGNIPIIGHRTSHAKPFSRFGVLTAGDVVYLDTADFRYTYVLVEDRIVRDDAVWVLDQTPLPARTGEALLTLITCTPRGSTSHRWVWFATLEHVAPHLLPAQ